MGACFEKAAAAFAVAALALSACAVTTRELFDAVKDKVVAVQCDGSAGLGFVCEMDGARYFLTNKQVIDGRKSVSASFPDGGELGFGKLEIAEGADLVRFAVASNQPALRQCTDPPKTRQKVFVFGKTGAAGVASDFFTGQVVGVEPGRVEVTARFSKDGIGGVVLGEDGTVLGMATFAADECSPRIWVRKDAHAQDTRRFALRLSDVRWLRTGLDEFNRRTAEEKAKKWKAAGVFPQTQASFKAPSMRVNRTRSRYFLNGNIVLGLSRAKGVKNPVVRVAALLWCGSGNVVVDSVMCEPGGKYAYSDVPIYSYGMPLTNASYDVGDGKRVCCIEGLSYFQRNFSLASAKNIEYFERTELLTGGIPLPDAPVLPKVIAFRLECWQNGSLAAAYDSVRPNMLKAKNIPVDWFVMGRHPDLFSYHARR